MKIILFIISIVSYSIANPIPYSTNELESGSGSNSGSEFDSGSGTYTKPYNNNNKNENDNDHKCETSCKILSYSLLVLLSCCLGGLCLLLSMIIYECCVKDMIHNCFNSIENFYTNYIKNICLLCKTNTTTQDEYIENDNYQHHDFKVKETTFYDRFAIMYNSIVQKEKPLNTECPICLDPINKNIYILTCKHAYHIQCMKDFINSDNSNKHCAMCREPINV